MEETSLASERLERDLEGWLEKDPDLLGCELLVIGRQVRTTSGPLDLLAVDELGALYIIELKRSKLPREAVAQALDYAAWLNSISREEVIRIAEEFLPIPFDKAFQSKFDVQMPDITPQNHKILIVGTGLDAGAERLVGYLSQRPSVDINAILFRYVKIPGAELLVRSVLVPESLSRSTKRHRPQPSKLLDEAKSRAAGILVNSLRALSSAGGTLAEADEYVSEYASRAYGGSFRNWRADRSGTYRMAFGIAVTGYWGAESAEVDVWVRPREMSQVTGLSEKKVRDKFSRFNIIKDKTRGNRLVIRLRSEKEANAFVKTLKKLFDVSAGP